MNSRTAQLSSLTALFLLAVACESLPTFEPDSESKSSSNNEDDDDKPKLGLGGGSGMGGDNGCEDDCEPKTMPAEKFCGDGVINQDDEECDDGKTVGGDGCSSDCEIEKGWSCEDEGKACEASACGDGVRVGTEQCDDGNSEGGDGCTPACQAEPFYDCPAKGGECDYVVKCGDHKVQDEEVCDDGNSESGDGCDSKCSKIEKGWACPIQGVRCEAAECGDGKVAGGEQCDEGDIETHVGCNDDCTLMEGFKCEGSPSECEPTVCGDDKKEGTEACDDGNLAPWDGCSPTCQPEPSCPPGGGACSSTCGDSMILPGDDEECDDGNTLDGDGCSSKCQEEDGWTCEAGEKSDLPDTWNVPVVYRDFNRAPKDGGTQHPDFETYGAGQRTPGLVAPGLDDEDGLPVYTGICEQGSTFTEEACPDDEQTTGETEFDQWYRKADGINYELFTEMTLTRQEDDSYSFTPAQLFPVNDFGFTDPEVDLENPSSGNNFGFTTELRGWFAYEGGERLDFSGDDDVWVFINGKLALDMGGLHPQRDGYVLLEDGEACESYEGGDEFCTTDLGLEKGKVYEIALFHAERHTGASNFNLTMRGFVKNASECETTCGDGIVAGAELCDDGKNDGGYDGCMPGCMERGPYCGDGDKDKGEKCDDGVNTSLYEGCASGCVLGPTCGDGEVQPAGGEQCDDGDNNGGYDECAEGCEFDERCGDGEVQEDEGEKCDDGINNGDYGTCAPGCKEAPRCGDGEVQRDEGEKCDDGNTKNGDACPSNCKEPKLIAK